MGSWADIDVGNPMMMPCPLIRMASFREAGFSFYAVSRAPTPRTKTAGQGATQTSRTRRKARRGKYIDATLPLTKASLAAKIY
jgi:hypothetical protein